MQRMHGLSTDEMVEALQATGAEIRLVMREPRDWHVSAAMEVAEAGLRIGKYGNGATPQDAILNHWAIYSATTREKPAIFKTSQGERRLWWSGFMWRDA